MTKNNLRAHLAWLLERPNPLDQFVIPQVSSDVQLASTDSVNAEPTVHLETNIGQPTSGALSAEAIPSALRAAAPGSDDVPADNIMAILQLASPPPRNRLHGTPGTKSSVNVPGTPANRSSKKRALYKTESETPKPRSSLQTL